MARKLENVSFKEALGQCDKKGYILEIYCIKENRTIRQPRIDRAQDDLCYVKQYYKIITFYLARNHHSLMNLQFTQPTLHGYYCHKNSNPFGHRVTLYLFVTRPRSMAFGSIALLLLAYLAYWIGRCMWERELFRS